MEKLMGMESTHLRTDLPIRALGSMMSKKAMERRLGQTNPTLKENTKKEPSMEKVNISTLMGLCTKEIGVIIKYLAMVHTLGQMEKAMTVNGLTIICMVTEPSHGLMGDDTKGIT
jgi:hypothetical protein